MTFIAIVLVYYVAPAAINYVIIRLHRGVLNPKGMTEIEYSWTEVYDVILPVWNIIMLVLLSIGAIILLIEKLIDRLSEIDRRNEFPDKFFGRKS